MTSVKLPLPRTRGRAAASPAAEPSLPSVRSWPLTLGLSLGVTLAIIGWAVLVFAAIDAARLGIAGDRGAWTMVAITAVGAAVALFLAMLMCSRLWSLIATSAETARLRPERPVASTDRTDDASADTGEDESTPQPAGAAEPIDWTSFSPPERGRGKSRHTSRRGRKSRVKTSTASAPAADPEAVSSAESSPSKPAAASGSAGSMMADPSPDDDLRRMAETPALRDSRWAESEPAEASPPLTRVAMMASWPKPASPTAEGTRPDASPQGVPRTQSQPEVWPTRPTAAPGPRPEDPTDPPSPPSPPSRPANPGDDPLFGSLPARPGGLAPPTAPPAFGSATSPPPPPVASPPAFGQPDSPLPASPSTPLGPRLDEDSVAPASAGRGRHRSAAASPEEPASPQSSPPPPPAGRSAGKHARR